MRAVLDPNVFVSAFLAPSGAPARVLLAWRDGAFELICSPHLLAELERVLAYPKLRKRIPAEDAAEALRWIARGSIEVADPTEPPGVRCEDPDDDYLLALAEREYAALVSGDRHVLAFTGQLPVYAPADFLALLE